MNLLCGVIGVVFTLRFGRPDIAFLLMLAAAGFDFCDGLSARLLNAYSDIGKELDSLADMVSFGVLPSVMLFKIMDKPSNGWFCYLPLIIAVFSALRLAKFNIDERQHYGFIGLATPASAMICGSAAYLCMDTPMSSFAQLCYTPWFLPVVAVILSLLMVSEIPMFAMKFGGGAETDALTKMKRTAFLTITAIIVIIVFLMHWNWAAVVLLMFTVYILMNLIFYLFAPKGK